MKFNNEAMLYDTQGNLVHAHGGHIFTHEGMFYFIGENRIERNRVACYASKDLVEWEFRNNILTLDAPTQKHYVESELALELMVEEECKILGCNVERPKVIYNKHTGKFVMWMHWEKPTDYSEARCAVAVCDTVDGDYTYLGSFNPIGHMSRDCTLFVDTDETAYFISAARDNQDLHIYRLSEDYLSIEEHVKTLWPGQLREAPTVFKREGYYYMLSSWCTGWCPNQGKYARATAIDGRWSVLEDFGDETTYRSQPTCVLAIQGTEEKSFLYIGDRWGGSGEAYFSSSYVCLPLKFDTEGKISMTYFNEIEVDLIKGTVEGI